MSRQFDSADARRFWEVHVDRRAPVDFDEDPDALGNVCRPNEPLWVNRHYAAGQHQAFLSLLERTGLPGAGCRALDIGCGGGRWSRLLADRGFAVTGIDLQRQLVERNARVFPHISFVHSAVQDFRPPEPFDLVCSVTVLQHIPAGEHPAVVEAIKGMLRPGGYALHLENVRDTAAYVYPRSVEGWREVFGDVGFRLIGTCRYDYNPSLRALYALRSLRGRLVRRRGSSPEVTPEDYLLPPSTDSPARRLARSVLLAGMRAGVALDRRIEPALIRRNPPLPSVHCGFLFRT